MNGRPDSSKRREVSHGWRVWASGLVTPSPRLSDSRSRDRSSVLAALLLFMAGAMLLMVLLLRLVVGREAGWANPEAMLAAACGLLLLSAYALNRRGHYLCAASLTVGILLASVLIGTHMGLSGTMKSYLSGNALYVLAYLLLPVLLGAVMLPMRLAVLTLCFAIAGALYMPLRHPQVSWEALLYGPLVYVVTICVLLLFVSFVINVLQGRQYRVNESRENRYRNLFEQSLDAIYTVAYDGSHMEVNQAWLDLHGYSREELPHLNAAEMYAEPTGRLDFLKRIEKSGFVKDEVRFKKKDGTIIECRRRVVVLRDEAGRIVELQGVIHDISEQKRSERELRESEQRYRLVADDTIDVIWRMDMDLRFTYVNPAIESMFGFTPEQWTGTSLAEHCSMDEFQRMHGIVVYEVEHLSAHVGARFDTLMFGRDGVEFPVEIHAKILADSGNRPYAIHGMTRDITERKRAERELRDSEEKYRELFEQSIDAVCLVAVDGMLIDANAAYLRLYGLEKSDIGRFNVRETYLDPEMREDFLKRMEVEGAIVEGEVRRRKRDGTIMDVHRSSTARRDAEGRIIAFQSFTQDITARKKAEAELLQSEAKYRMLYEQSFDAVAVFAVDGTLLDANPAHLRLFGLTTDDIGRNVVLELYVNPADREEFLRVMQRDGFVVDQQVQLQKVDGTLMDCVRTAVGRFDAEGCLVSVQTVTHDVTERINAQRQLRESEEKYRTLFEQSADPVALVSVDGTILDANHAWLTVHGYALEDIGKVNVIDGYVNPEERQQVLRQLEAEGFIKDAEVVRKRKDGTLMRCQFSAVARRDGEGRLVAMQTVSRDVTERTRAEEELRESEARFRKMSELLPLAICEADRYGNITFANRKALEVFGYADEGMEGRVNVVELLAPEDRERAAASFQSTLSGGDVSGEFLARRKDGTAFPLQVDSNTIFRDGKPVGSRAVLTDISDRKKTEQQLHDLAAHIEEVREDERTGIARELHDQLGQALTALKFDLQDVARRIRGHKDVPMDNIVKMDSLLDATVDDVRRISSELRPGILDDLGLLAAIDWQLAQFRERTGLECELSANTDDVNLDRARTTALFRVFQELLTNVARHADARHVRVALECSGANCVMTVSDDGRGMTEEQSNAAASLGLIGIHERVRPLHGEVTFSGLPGKGTTARVSMPVK